MSITPDLEKMFLVNADRVALVSKPQPISLLYFKPNKNKYKKEPTVLLVSGINPPDLENKCPSQRGSGRVGV